MATWSLLGTGALLMERFTIPLMLLLAVCVPAALLALPMGMARRSWKRFFEAYLLSLFGIWIPLLVFVARGIDGPVWRGESRFGWFGCFEEGSIALLPVAIAACVGFYRYAIIGRFAKPPRWAIACLVAGQIVSVVCLGIGLLMYTDGQYRSSEAFFLVPIYVAAWYAWMCLRIARDCSEFWKAARLSLLSSLPFWVASLLYSKAIYNSLPETPPDCFVVTAASLGHARIVGPLFEIEHRGSRRLANRQLATFWQFEAAWKARSPRTHWLARRVYGRIGPVVARRIAVARWRADCVYLALKPIELVARFAVGTRGGS